MNPPRLFTNEPKQNQQHERSKEGELARFKNNNILYGSESGDITTAPHGTRHQVGVAFDMMTADNISNVSTIDKTDGNSNMIATITNNRDPLFNLDMESIVNYTAKNKGEDQAAASHTQAKDRFDFYMSYLLNALPEGKVPANLRLVIRKVWKLP